MATKDKLINLEDLKVLSDHVEGEVTDLKSDLEEITETGSTTTTTEVETTKTNNKYVTNTGSTDTNTMYFHTSEIPVQSGDIITAVVGELVQQMRFICAYVNGTVDSSKGSSSYLYSYTVPDGVTSVIVTCLNRFYEDMVFKRTRTTIVAYPKGINELSASVSTLENSIVTTKNSVEATAATLESGGTLLVAERIDNKKNCSYIVWGNFASFDSIIVAHGYTSYGGSYVVVDDTNITAYYYNGSSAVVMGTYAHGLTISDFIQINIKVKNAYNLRASVSIMTKEGMFTQSEVSFGGCNGNIFVRPTMAMQNVKAQYIIDDLKEDVFIFGDSYVSLGDPSRWPNQIMLQDYPAFLISGYSGATSASEIVSFRSIMAIKKPSYVVWALGMNDADSSSAYNASWKTCIDEVINTCETSGVELILATIPNVPNISHIYKNAYVRSSGYRYVDFAKAVGAESVGSSWYTGMLSTDNVHPTELGAKALAARFLVDVPEIV